MDSQTISHRAGTVKVTSVVDLNICVAEVKGEVTWASLWISFIVTFNHMMVRSTLGSKHTSFTH